MKINSVFLTKKIALTLLILSTAPIQTLFSMQSYTTSKQSEIVKEYQSLLLGSKNPQIHNVIWDLFKVLIWVDKKSSEQDMPSLTPQPSFKFDPEKVMSCATWPKLDLGFATADDVANDETLKNVQDPQTSKKFIENIGTWVKPIRSGMEMFKEIYQQGFNLFILSNISEYCLNQIHNQKFIDRAIDEDKFDYPHIFDPNIISGEVYSCSVHVGKPSISIFGHFLNKYCPSNMTPEDFAKTCVFIDDNKSNLEAAREANIFSVSCQCHEVAYLTLVKAGLIQPNEEIERYLNQQYFAYFKNFDLNELQDFNLVKKGLDQIHTK